MSCNGCRVLRRGCSATCILRPCIQCIDGAGAQAHATAFVAKFFGRSTLLSFLSSVPLPRRPAAFRSLLYEACGRTINPVTGATGLLWTGNWHLCQAAVATVLGGGTIHPLPELAGAADAKELYEYQRRGVSSSSSSSSPPPRKRRDYDAKRPPARELYPMPESPDGGGVNRRRASTPSATSASSVTTISEGGCGDQTAAETPTILNLFV
ncbi:LOB domain-containing protein 37-like [Musa acuminata AAA Group]|uniref:LOB domain-containing protein 37-like n=1 Tax=Musa acuminata AAA Group TaxID=214697 RepID=UPI0031D76ECA